MNRSVGTVRCLGLRRARRDGRVGRGQNIEVIRPKKQGGAQEEQSKHASSKSSQTSNDVDPQSQTSPSCRWRFLSPSSNLDLSGPSETKGEGKKRQVPGGKSSRRANRRKGRAHQLLACFCHLWQGAANIWEPCPVEKDRSQGSNRKR